MYPCKSVKIPHIDSRDMVDTKIVMPTPRIRTETNMSPSPFVGGHNKWNTMQLNIKFFFFYIYFLGGGGAKRANTADLIRLQIQMYSISIFKVYGYTMCFCHFYKG